MCGALQMTTSILKPRNFILLFCFYNSVEMVISSRNRLQRRFMWKQIDSVDSLMRRVLNSARAMKNIVGEILPPSSTAPAYSTKTLEYLPTEMTRIKYIIRNPHTNKPMKVIKLRGTPKKLKIMSLPKHILEHEISSIKNMPNHSNYETSFRLLENEKKLISQTNSPFTDNMDKAEILHDYKKTNDKFAEVVTGKIHENANWKPIQRENNNFSTLRTHRPQIRSQLNTEILMNSEFLPRPEKIVGNANNKKNLEVEHTYEVTEQSLEGTSSVETQTVKKLEVLNGFFPSHGFYHQQRRKRIKTKELDTTTDSSILHDLTNYPENFMKRSRVENEKLSIAVKQRNKEEVYSLQPNWTSTENLKFSTNEMHDNSEDQYNDNIGKFTTILKQEFTKAPTTASPFNMPSPRPDPKKLQIDDKSTKKTQSESLIFPLSKTFQSKDFKKMNERYRGSVKFLDKIIYDEI